MSNVTRITDFCPQEIIDRIVNWQGGAVWIDISSDTVTVHSPIVGRQPLVMPRPLGLSLKRLAFEVAKNLGYTHVDLWDCVQKTPNLWRAEMIK